MLAIFSEHFCMQAIVGAQIWLLRNIKQSNLHVTQASEMMELLSCMQQPLLKIRIFLYDKIMRANLVVLVNFAKCNIT